jgi:pimeloyl-ACP methyl ester carboxylesterase
MRDGAFALTLADGRRLEGWASGAGPATGVLLQMGTPCAGVPYELFVRAVVDRDCRFVTYSRPGYAGSSRQAGRSVADCTSDVAAIADELALERLHVIGWSGGGPHALACAALLPPLVASVATIAGVAPASAEGLDWPDGMADENREEFAAAQTGTDALTAFLEAAAVGLRGQTGEKLADALGGLLTEVDRRALTGSLADYLASVMQAALKAGIWGWHDDDLAFTRDWGFSLDEIAVPVAVWQGRVDAMVPFAHGRWLAEHVPGARARFFEDEGHISLVLRFGEIVDELLRV